MLDHPGWQLTGHALNWTSLAILSIETVVLLALCGDKRAWLRHHKWSLLITVVAVPAVIYGWRWFWSTRPPPKLIMDLGT